MDDIDTRISELMMLGWSTWKIAKEVNRSKVTVAIRRNRLLAMPDASYPAVVDPRVWSAENSERMKNLWNEGLSASQIGGILGFSRSAIIGRAHRMGLPRRKVGSVKGTPKPRASRARAAIFVAPVPTNEPSLPPIHIIDLENRHCRYPKDRGMDGLVMYCGARKEEVIRDGKKYYTGPYCPFHADRCTHPDYRNRMFCSPVGQSDMAVDNQERQGEGL